MYLTGMQRRVVHYARVSDEERNQGFSINSQLHNLRLDSRAKGDEVVGEVVDDGYSGATPDRPGWLEVMELAESGAVDVVKAIRRDRLFRSRLYRLMADQDLAEIGVKLEALNDTGHKIADGVQDDYSEYEREEIVRRTLAGKLQKAREGKVIAGRLPVHGYRFSADRNHYEADEAKLAGVRKCLSLLASGRTVAGTCRDLEALGLPSPGGKKWQKPTVRAMAYEDCYVPHTFAEVSVLVSPEVSGRLDPDLAYGVWWYNRRASVKTRNGKRIKMKPRSEWVAVPVPDAGVPRETAEMARSRMEENKPASSAGRREWELSGGIARCGHCGCAMCCHTATRNYTKKDGAVSRYVRFYYVCPTNTRLGGKGCPMNRSLHAAHTEEAVWDAFREAMLDPDRVARGIEASKRGKGRGKRSRSRAVLARLEELGKRRGGLIDLAADGLLPKAELADRLGPLDAEIAALSEESEATRREEARRVAGVEDARLLLRRLKAGAPKMLGALGPAQRRNLYERLGLKVVANLDRSLTITWMAGHELGELRCLKGRTSRDSLRNTTQNASSRTPKLAFVASVPGGLVSVSVA